jgi:hypothetical protein
MTWGLDICSALPYSTAGYTTFTMTITTNERGEQNMFANEPKMYITEEDMQQNELETYAERAEKMNGRFAMMGFIAAIGAYALTGQVIPGIW